ncbi:hypothetical protein D3C81_1072830 [compost metagenome]
MATANRATTCRCRPCCRRFQFGGRVHARGDRLLQLFHRRRGLRGSLTQVGTAVGCISAPLGITAQIEQAAIGQFEGDGAARAGENFFTGQQAITFNEYTSDAFWGYCDDLANNTFDDGYNAAHWTLRVTRCDLLPCSEQRSRATADGSVSILFPACLTSNYRL